jgi:hypothetical protein
MEPDAAMGTASGGRRSRADTVDASGSGDGFNGSDPEGNRGSLRIRQLYSSINRPVAGPSTEARPRSN